MKQMKMSNLDLDLFYEKLENGLEVYIIPKKDCNNTYVTYSTKYGSRDYEFVPIGEKKMVQVPGGVAHFLEHKMFEQEDGTDPFTFFGERGADANANTNYRKTTYLFSGTQFLEENLRYLLEYVEAPYFTDENVEKEKGIIEQEIMMYEDSPYTKAYEGLLYNIFVNDPIKYPIIGTVKSVRSITKKDLYDCYNTFYHPSNMFVVITGKVEPNEAIKVIKEVEKERHLKEAKKVEKKEIKEPREVAKEYEEKRMTVTIPKLSIGYKIPLNLFKHISKRKIIHYLMMLFDIKLGPVSLLQEQLKKEHLMTSDFSFDYITTEDYFIVMLIAETPYPEKVIEFIQKELCNLELEEKDLNRKRKTIISSFIFMSDNIYSLNEKAMNNIIQYGKVNCDDYEEIKSLNIEEYQKLLPNIHLENKSIYVIYPKKDSK